MTVLKSLTIKRPDDWHLHLRDGDMLNAVLPWTTHHFARAIVMPNLVPPVVTMEDAKSYLSRINEATGETTDFQPLMTLYLTEQSDPDDVEAAHAADLVKGVKLYPAGATTNSDSGVKSIERVYPLLERMEKIGLPLLVHGEVVDADIDIFDREAVFIERILTPVRKKFPGLKIVLEHVTTRDGVEYVKSCEENTAATITPHHLMINRNHMLVGGIRPHYYCLPIVKRAEHQLALRAAATSGDTRFFLGTDSAPHPINAKESACGCAGVFNVANTLSCLAHVFDEEDALDRLEGFTSLHGPAFYGLPVNDAEFTLEKRDQPATLPASIDVGDETVVIFDPGTVLHWHVLTEGGNR